MFILLINDYNVMQKIKIAFIVGVIILSLVSTISIMYNKYVKTLQENERIRTNLEYYESKCSQNGAENIVLRHTVKELSNSKDSLIQDIEILRKKLKLKPNQVNTIIHTETIIKDTLKDTITLTVDFHAIVTPNSQTSIEVIRKDSTLTIIPNIRNSQTVFVYTDKKYKYKSWFSRLIHFNFKKIITERFVIENSNNLIKTGESRVVNVEH